MLRSYTIPFLQEEEYSGEPQMVKEMRAGRETSMKDCLEYLNTLSKFNHYIFQDFLNLMKDFKTKGDDFTETLKQKVKELFQGCPDLILGFNAFLPKGHEINVPIPIQVLSRKRKCDDDNSTTDDAVVDAGYEDSKLRRVMAFVNRVQERFRHDDEDTVFKSFLDIFLNMHSKRNKSSPNKSITTEEDELQIYKKVAALFKGHPDLIDEFAHFLPTVPLFPLSSIIDFSNCKTCTPSYRLLPKNFPIPAATHRSELVSQVLNDRWVCVETTTSTNSRRGGGHIMHKSQHEQNLFRWEEQRFELDRSVESVNSASKSIKVLLEKIDKDSPSVIYIKDHLTELDWRCIERLYDEQGLEAMDEVRKNIRVALPVMLYRLKQKKEKLKQCQSDLNQRWAQKYVKKRRH